MAVTWKEVALADNVPNLGNANLTSTATTRTFTLQGEVGNAAKRLKIEAEAVSGESLTLMDIYTGNYPVVSGTWGSSEVNFNAGSIGFNATSIASIASDFVMTLSAPYFTANIDSFTIQSLNTTASSMPVLSLKRLPNPDDVGQTNDNIGQIKFEGENDAAGAEVYASIDVKIHDATATSEDGEMDIQLMTGGYSQSHLKILPNSAQTETLKRIEVSGTDLWTLVQSATMYNCRKQLKLRAAHGQQIGLQEGNATLFRFADLEQYSPLNNYAYDINGSALTNWIAGGTNILAAEGTVGLMAQDADFDSGIADAWMMHKRSAGSPSVTIKVHGVVWWQSRYNQLAGQQVQFHWGYHGRSATQETDIVDNNDFGFSYGGTASEEYDLGSGYTINKLPVSFTKTFDAGGDGDVLEMFILAIKATNTNGVGAIGQSASNESAAAHNSTFVADLEMEVLSISA